MQANVNFWTPVYYKNAINQKKTVSQRFFETAENYFYLNGRRACIISSQANSKYQEVEFNDEGWNWKESTKKVFLTALKVASYLFIIPPILLLVGKYIYRQQHHFYTFDTVADLEQGINISLEVEDQLRKHVYEIQQGNAAYPAEKRRQVSAFCVDTAPNLIFKFAANNDETQNLFQHLVTAKKICRLHGLNKLVVPQAKLVNLTVEGTNVSLIAEIKLDIDFTETSQKEILKKSGQLTEAFRQLTTFICKTGFCELTPLNTPIINSTDPDSKEIALLDLSIVGQAASSLFGDNLLSNAPKDKGIFSWIDHANQQTIIDEAKLHLAWSAHLAGHVQTQMYGNLK